MPKQISAIQLYRKRGLGVRGQFFGKKIAILALFGLHFARL